MRGRGARLVVRVAGGVLASGRWVRGRREGQGTLSSPALERRGVTIVKAEYRAGVAEGGGRLVLRDATVLQGHFLHGFFHGPARGMRLTKGRGGGSAQALVWVGTYSAGRPSGCCWAARRGGGWLVGR